MSSTNKTTNYELSQYVGSDKPTYLGDYNSDMAKIDAQMKRNAEGITTVDAKATTAGTNASTALTNAGTAQTTAESAQTTANSANTTATSALAKATTNESKILSLESSFNLSDITQYLGANMTFQNCTYTAGSITVATNEDGTVGKIYGNVIIQNDGTNQVKHILIPNTKLRPDTAFNIYPIGIFASSPGLTEAITCSLDTNGNLDFTVYGSATGTGNVIILPCIYFMKDFGDTNQ